MTSPPKRCGMCDKVLAIICNDHKSAVMKVIEVHRLLRNAPAPAPASGETKPLSHLWIKGHLSRAHQDGKHAKPAQGCPDCPPTVEPSAVERGCMCVCGDTDPCGCFAAGRAEALKPLREIYARGRVTFRSDGTLSSLDAQEREFEAALDESGEGEK